MKHSFGLTIGLYARQRDYSRGQTLRQWLVSGQWGCIGPGSFDGLHIPGGHETRSYWLRITVVDVSVQMGVEHAISNWTRRKGG
jgi:hypothetical protein